MRYSPSPRPPGALRGAAAHLAALAGYLLLAALLTWPTVLAFDGLAFTSAGGRFAYPGHDDIVQNVWNLWWVRRALAEGLSPFFTPLLYHPEGVQMAVQTLNLTSALLTLPVQLAWGEVAAYNAGLLLAFALTGYAAFLLARLYAPSARAAWLAGALVTAAPFHMMKLEVNHFNLLNMQWLALTMAALVWAQRRPSLWAAPPLALCLVLTALTDWYWALVAAAYCLAWALIALARGPRRGGLLARYALGAGLAAAALAPLLLQIWRLRGRLAPPPAISGAPWQEWVRGYSADALGLLFPSLRQPLWTGAAEGLTAALLGDVPLVEGWYVAAGWTLMGLALAGALRHGRRHWPLLAAGAAMWLLSLGPELRVAGLSTGLPMPYALIGDLPLVALARRPNLFAAPCIVIAGVFAALALSDLLAWPGRRRPLALAAVVGLAALELWPVPRYGVSLEAPALYAALAGRPGAVIDLPVGADIEARSLRNQIAHGQPIVRGYVARPPDYPALRHNPLLAALARGQPLPERDILPLDRPALQLMQCRYRFRHLVIDEGLVEPGLRASALDALARLEGAPPAPWRAEAGLSAYELAPPDGPCAPFAYLGAGWGEVERDGGRLWRWLGARGELYLVNPGPTEAGVVLELAAEGFDPDGSARPTPVRLLLGGREVGAFAAARGARSYRIPLRLPPGETRLELLAGARTDPAGRPLSLSVAQLRLVSIER